MEMRFTYNSDQVAMYRVKTLRGFERMIEVAWSKPEKAYRLFISYKCRHRIKNLADRCFMWDETEETRNGIDVESGEQGFGEPRFDGVWAALFITDDGIVAFGDARLIASVAQRCRERMEAESEKENDDVSGFFRTQDTPVKQEKKQACKQSKKVFSQTPTGFF